MSTDPFTPAAPAWLAAGPVQHLTDFTVQAASGDIVLPVEAGTITYHGTAIPSYTGTLTCPVTVEGRDMLDALDPRSTPRCVLRAGYRFPDGTTEIRTMGVVFPTDSEWTVEDGRLQVSLASQESTVNRAIVWRNQDGVDMPRTGVAEAVAYILDKIVPGRLVFRTDVPYSTRAGGLAEYEVPGGANWLDVLEDITQAADLRLYVDRVGDWHLSTRTDTPTPAAATVLACGPTGTVTSLQRRTSRDQWANAVRVRARWSTEPVPAVPAVPATETTPAIPGRAAIPSEPREITGSGQVVGAPWGVDVVGAHVHTVEIDHRVHITHVRAKAWAMLSRMYRLGAGHNVEAVAAYWLRPDHTVHLIDENGAGRHELVRNVTYDLAAGTMALSTRDDVAPTIIE